MTDQAAPSPFDESINSVEEGISNFFLVRHRALTFILIIGTFTAISFFAWLEWNFSDWTSLTEDERTSAIMFPFLPLFVPIFIWLWASLKVQASFKRQLAVAIGFSYAEHAAIVPTDGHLYDMGTDRYLMDVYSGQYHDLPARILTLTLVVGGGKSSTLYHFPVWELDYKRALPHILMKPREGFPLQGRWKPEGTVAIELEGGFNESFELYAEPENQIEVRQLFEPNVMSTFVNDYAAFGLETYGTKLYVFRANANISTKKTFIELRAFIDSLYDKLLPELRDISNPVA